MHKGNLPVFLIYFMVHMSSVLGYVDFDSNVSQDSSHCIINVSVENVDKVHRGSYVRIESSDGRVFLARVRGGPFYFIEGLPSSSPLAKTFTIRGDRFRSLPSYYAAFTVNILGEIEGGRLRSSYTRPKPKSPVYEMTAREVEEIMGFKGNVLLGHLHKYKNVKVKLPAGSMDFLPRNVGIFGTVGSGKTNTAQVLIEEASRAGWAVFVLDVEGEYTFMDQPNNDEPMVNSLKSIYRMEPEGLKDFKVYVPAGRSSVRFDAVGFTIPFHEMDPFILFEIIEATEAQQRYFLEILGEFEQEARTPEKSVGEEFEEMLISPIEERSIRFTLMDVMEKVENRLREGQVRHVASSLQVISSKLERLRRYRIFDGRHLLPVEKRIKPGAVTVIDLSDTEDQVRNIVIAWLLNKIFELKVLEPNLPSTMIVIEEAHTFVSREAREKMTATIDMLKTIARRGRKRRLSLVFISQQPGHLPPEIFELCNTRIIHTLKSEYNIRALRETSGAVRREYWDLLPALSVGEAILVSPLLLEPVLIKVRPAKSMKYRYESLESNPA